LAMLVGGGSMLLSSYAIVVAWGVGNATTLGSANVPIVQLAARVSGVLALAVVMLSVNSLIVSNVGTNMSASRILFSLSREGGAPATFSKVHESHKSPYVASLFVGVIAIIIGLAAPMIMGFMDAYSMVAIAASIFWILGRLGDSVSLPLFYLKRFREEFSVLKHLVPSAIISVINVLGLGLAIFPITYPTNISIIFVVSAMICWVGGFMYFGRNRENMIGAYLVNDAGELVITSPPRPIAAKK